MNSTFPAGLGIYRYSEIVQITSQFIIIIILTIPQDHLLIYSKIYFNLILVISLDILCFHQMSNRSLFTGTSCISRFKSFLYYNF